MQSFGQILFAIGCGILIWSGVVGIDLGAQIRVANLAGLIIGASLVVAGAVFWIGAMAIGAIHISSEDHFRTIDQGFDDVKIMIGYPIEKVPEVIERDEKRSLLASVVKGRHARKYYFMGKRFEARKSADAARAQFIAKYGRA